MKYVVFDIDGTLANNDHRKHLIEGREDQGKDWDAFYDACDGDTPNRAVVELAKVLHKSGYTIDFWSGRMDQGDVRRKTSNWLQKHTGIYSYELRMRPKDDFTPDEELKRAWLNEVRNEYCLEPVFVVDDRDKVVKMWREEGITCFQVAEGDF